MYPNIKFYNVINIDVKIKVQQPTDFSKKFHFRNFTKPKVLFSCFDVCITRKLKNF